MLSADFLTWLQTVPWDNIELIVFLTFYFFYCRYCTVVPLPYPGFCFLSFQLPVLYGSLKILNGKFWK